MGSLLARMITTKYCRNRSFMEISPRSTASHGWRGLLVGIDLLKQGLGMAIGDGTTARVWRDACTGLITTGPPPLHTDDLVVADLLQGNNNNWDQEKVEELFPGIWQEIMQLQTSRRGQPDRFVWTHTVSGEYTTRTGYYVALENKCIEETSKRYKNFQWKTEIWKTITSPKTQMLM